MRVLRRGVRGEDVLRWQRFLHGAGFLFKSAADGVFGSETEARTKEFQAANGLEADGLVGNATLATAMASGFQVVDFLSEPESGFPALPGFDAISGNEGRQALFGPLKFKAGPRTGGFGKETITIQNNFETDKIKSVVLPGLAGVGGSSSGKARIHKNVEPQMVGLWTAWKKLDLTKLVLTWEGSYAPRFIRCSDVSLSNHAFGTAFDINADFNRFGAQPALPGEKGCVFELVPVAHKFGFYWGGHFKSRPDGMHFEVAKILSQADVDKVLAKI